MPVESAAIIQPSTTSAVLGRAAVCWCSGIGTLRDRNTLSARRAAFRAGPSPCSETENTAAAFAAFSHSWMSVSLRSRLAHRGDGGVRARAEETLFEGRLGFRNLGHGYSSSVEIRAPLPRLRSRSMRRAEEPRLVLSTGPVDSTENSSRIRR